MTIRTEISEEWREVLSVLTDEERRLLIGEADHLASAIAYRNHQARLSTNGALELLFALACWENKSGCPITAFGHDVSKQERKGNHE